MKTNTHEEISFTNCHAGIYLSKNEGAIAVDFKSQEIVLYLNTSLYQSLAWLLYSASETKEIMDFVNWEIDPKSVTKNALIELHGPDHAACMVCSPLHERIQLNLEIGVSIDLKFSDFKGLLELAREAQSDLEWRRHLLQWPLSKDITDHHDHDHEDKKAI